MKEIIMNEKTLENLTKLRPASLSDAEYQEELRKAEKGISVRIDAKWAPVLVYLDADGGMSKAGVIKSCMDRALLEVAEERLAAQQRLIKALHAPDGISSQQRAASDKEAAQVKALSDLAAEPSSKRSPSRKRR